MYFIFASLSIVELNPYSKHLRDKDKFFIPLDIWKVGNLNSYLRVSYLIFPGLDLASLLHSIFSLSMYSLFLDPIGPLQ